MKLKQNKCWQLKSQDTLFLFLSKQAAHKAAAEVSLFNSVFFNTCNSVKCFTAARLTGKQKTSSSVDLLFLMVDIWMPWETWRKAAKRKEKA